ncbi:hypothetical protein Sango_1846500 [Sesamum angolense]|uniref:Uncharacterized protein n=1 Tax=Sesamum angolense TaxID=2727404 RepID=A0AAE1WI41_9LAMI|nr:hypothetical protein Sango_1846500 [Sesamum angolense]
MGRSSSDFEFWEETLPVDPRSCGDSFEGQRLVEDQEGAYSPPLWTRTPVDCRSETSSLLPRRHEHSFLSPASRLRAIVDGRRELMEMIQDLPESSYELTLKDIVDDQQNMEEVQEKEVIVEEKKVKHKTESRPQNSRKTKNRQICRTESMESEFGREFLVVFPMVLQQGELQVKRTKGVPVLNKFDRVAKDDHWNSPNKEYMCGVF